MTVRRRPSAPDAVSLACVIGLAVGAFRAGDCLAVQRGAVVRDSAGIRIVENRDPRWPPGAGWRIGTEPSLAIGTALGDEPYLFQRIVAARRLGGGAVVVAESGAGELRFLDRDGVFLHAAGGAGEGPGEFRFLSAAWTWSDTIAAYDNALLRLSVFAPDGGLVGTHSFRPAEGAGRPAAQMRFEDGTLLVLSAPSGMVPTGRGLLEGAAWRLDRYARDGTFLGEIAPLRESTRWGHDISGLPPMYLPLSLGLGLFASAGNAVYAGDGVEPSIRRLENDGTVTDLIRWPAPERRVTEGDKSRYRTANATPPPAFHPDAWSRYLREVPFPAAMPTYSRLVVDAGGGLWARRFTAPGEESSAWYVFAEDGVWLGEVDMPRGVRVLEIGADYVLGVRVEHLGVASVVTFPLHRDDP